MTIKRDIAVAVVSAYLGAGLLTGVLGQRAYPELNPLGVTFLALTWPNQIRCARVESNCNAIPSWMARYFFTSQKGERRWLKREPKP